MVFTFIVTAHRLNNSDDRRDHKNLNNSDDHYDDKIFNKSDEHKV